MPKKIKLVLSGSGTRYPVFAGAIRKLLHEGYEIEEVCGTSGGAIVAAALGAGYNPSNPAVSIINLMDLLYQSMPGPLLDPNWFPYKTRGIFKGNKILREFKKHFPKRFCDTKIPVNIVTFNMNTGKHVIWNNKSAGNVSLPVCVRASMSLPFIFNPVKIKNDLHIDGGVAANFPLDVFGTGKDVVGLRFDSAGPRYKKIENKIDLINATVDGMMNATMNEHIEDAMYARICHLKTKHGGLNLLMSKDEVQSQVNDGYLSMGTFLESL